MDTHKAIQRIVAISAITVGFCVSAFAGLFYIYIYGGDSDLFHQLPNGAPYVNSFYWRPDHNTGSAHSPVSCSAEDATRATLTLISINNWQNE